MIHIIDNQAKIKCLLSKHYFENTVREEIEISYNHRKGEIGFIILSVIAAINPIETLDVKYAIKEAVKIETDKHRKKLSIIQRIMRWFK
jgi:DNA polymerase III sliding clamp (beta) subunit (PCNA family)